MYRKCKTLITCDTEKNNSEQIKTKKVEVCMSSKNNEPQPVVVEPIFCNTFVHACDKN